MVPYLDYFILTCRFDRSCRDPITQNSSLNVIAQDPKTSVLESYVNVVSSSTLPEQKISMIGDRA